MTDAQRIAAWKALADAATRGPWRVEEQPLYDDDGAPIEKIIVSDYTGDELQGEDEDDIDFIAASREAVPALIAMLEAADARLTEARELIQSAVEAFEGEADGLSLWEDDWQAQARAFLASGEAQ